MLSMSESMSDTQGGGVDADVMRMMDESMAQKEMDIDMLREINAKQLRQITTMNGQVEDQEDLAEMLNRRVSELETEKEEEAASRHGSMDGGTPGQPSQGGAVVEDDVEFRIRNLDTGETSIASVLAPGAREPPRPKSVLGSKGFMCKHCYFESYSEVEVRGPFSGHKPTCERHGKEAPRGSEVSNGGGGREAGDGAYVAPSTQRPREAPSKDQALWKAARLAADDHAAQVRKASTSSTSSSSSNDGTAGTVGTAGTAGISGPSPNTKKAKQRAEIEKLKLEMAKSQTRLRSMRTKRDREEDIGLNQLNGTMDFSGGVNGPS